MKTKLLFICMFCIALFVSTTDSNATLLQWAKSQNPSVSGYMVYWGTSPTGEALGNRFVEAPVTILELDPLELTQKVTYYFRVTACIKDDSGNIIEESNPTDPPVAWKAGENMAPMPPVGLSVVEFEK